MMKIYLRIKTIFCYPLLKYFKNIIFYNLSIYKTKKGIFYLFSSKTEECTKELGLKDFDVERELKFGKADLITKDTGVRTRGMEKGDLYLPTETFT